MSTIRLESSDGVLFEIDIEVAKCCGTIKTMLEDCGMGDGEDESIIPLPIVDAPTLRLILIWAEHHKDDVEKVDEDDENHTDNISTWDMDFLKVDQSTLFELISAANYLDVKGLMDAACTTVKNMIKAKTPDEIRQLFELENDFSEDEQKAIREENDLFDFLV